MYLTFLARQGTPGLSKKRLKSVSLHFVSLIIINKIINKIAGGDGDIIVVVGAGGKTMIGRGLSWMVVGSHGPSWMVI